MADMTQKDLVTQIYHINLCCDKCGARMNLSKSEIEDDDIVFSYVCECGYHKKSRVAFPYVTGEI